jgi:hypothetical protein
VDIGAWDVDFTTEEQRLSVAPARIAAAGTGTPWAGAATRFGRFSPTAGAATLAEMMRVMRPGCAEETSPDGVRPGSLIPA